MSKRVETPHSRATTPSPTGGQRVKSADPDKVRKAAARIATRDKELLRRLAR